MRTWVLGAAAAAIFFTLIFELLPEGELKRVCGAAFSVLFTLLLLAPVRNGGLSGVTARIRSAFEKELAAAEADPVENGLVTEILAQYEQSCQKEITAYLMRDGAVSGARAELVLQREPDAADFGSIQHVYAYVQLKKEQTAAERMASWIAPIRIACGDAEKKAETDSGKKLEALAEALAAWLELDASAVTVFEED